MAASANFSVYSRAVRGAPKFSNSPPEVVSDLVTATLHQFDAYNFTKNSLRFNLRANKARL